MLKKLDWYIINKFLTTFFFVVLIILMVAFIIDFGEKVEKFIKEPITNREIWLEYYPSFLLFIAGMLWPLFTLISVIFFTSRMASNSEIISIFNAGVSYVRLIRPYLVAAFFLCLLHLLGNHYLLPLSNGTMLNIIYTYLDKNEDKGRDKDVHLFVAPDMKVFVRSYRKQDSTARDFRIEYFTRGELEKVIKANRAEWVKDSSSWKLSNYEIRTFDGLQESLELEMGKDTTFQLNLSPNDFVDYSSQQSMMTTPELLKHIDLLKIRGSGNLRKYKLELQRRTAEPFTIIILTIIGLSIASRKVRGGVGLHLAIGIGLGAIFIFVSRFAVVFASGQSISVFMGVWLPNLIFSIVAVFLISRAQK